ncbi:MAG: bifunctional oligoribonuclease/PAP phosphatase NrnA [Chitinophagaceae bacterium]|nr:bifunctional oligoribonuclease/PAP phosphatase NrnA [Chitinophagaceae bacterium]
MKPIQEIYSLLSQPRKVVVTMHQKPDPDAMGSSLALANVLTQLGHQVTVISPTNWPEFLKWMPGAKAVIDYESAREKGNKFLDDTEWLFCLDFNALHRTKHMAAKLAEIKCLKILIDHHEEPETASFDYGISLTSKSSTSEMIYDFIVDSGHESLINTDVAACLYAGIIGDTGSFRFPSTSPAVHRMAADLLQRGLNHTAVHEYLYDNFLEDRLKFIGHILLHRMEVLYEYNTALIAIPKSDLIKFNIRTGDTEGLVNYPLTIQGIRLSGLVIDRDEERKWSFRSKGKIDVNTFARKYFNGGGHFNASGGRSADSLRETVQKFKKAMIENASQLQ